MFGFLTFGTTLALTDLAVKKEIEASLERLGTDYVDVYMTHWQATPGTEYFVPRTGRLLFFTDFVSRCRCEKPSENRRMGSRYFSSHT